VITKTSAFKIAQSLVIVLGTMRMVDSAEPKQLAACSACITSTNCSTVYSGIQQCGIGTGNICTITNPNSCGAHGS